MSVLAINELKRVKIDMADEIDYEKENAEFMRQAWDYKVNCKPLPKYEIFLKKRKEWVEDLDSKEGKIPVFPDQNFYRWKKETVMHPGGEMPRPLTVEEAENLDCIYVPGAIVTDGEFELYGNHISAKQNKISYAEQGLAFKTGHDAIAAAKVIFAKGVEVK